MKTKGKLKEKQGISLIVLVITIIVIIILAVAVILSIANNNPISNANKAKFQNDLKSIQEEINLYDASQYAKNQGNYSALSTGGDDMKSKLSSVSDSYKDKVFVVEGKLYLNSDKASQDEKNWADELGIKRSTEGFTYSADGKIISKYEGNATEIIIPYGVEQIGETDKTEYPIFLNNTNIVSVVLPDGLKKIDIASFSGCNGITRMVLPKTITELGAGFLSSTNLKELIMYKSMFSDNGIFSTSKSGGAPDSMWYEIEPGYYYMTASRSLSSSMYSVIKLID